MAIHNKIGNHAEQLACDYLQKQGLRLLERNYSCYCGEIDLIMQDSEDIVFVEVRSRNSSEFANALESIDHYKQMKLIKTATAYLQKKQWFDKVAVRFDAIGLTDSKLEWIKNAFYADDI